MGHLVTEDETVSLLVSESMVTAMSGRTSGSEGATAAEVAEL